MHRPQSIYMTHCRTLRTKCPTMCHIYRLGAVHLWNTWKEKNCLGLISFKPRTFEESKLALISMRQLLDHAAENDYGVPAFNVNNLEQMRAIMEGARETSSYWFP